MDAVKQVTSEAAWHTYPLASKDRTWLSPEDYARYKKLLKKRRNTGAREGTGAAAAFQGQQQLKQKTGKIGSVVDRSLAPQTVLENPPSVDEVTLELLMASQTHLGHHKSRWNVDNARYIYGIRDDIHIISLETTAAHLRRAARVVEEVAFHGGLILFAGTRKGQFDIVTTAAEMAGGCHLFSRWTPGMMTNRDIIHRESRVKMVDAKDEPIEGFRAHERDRRSLIPDLVVCLNPKENKTLLYECGLSSVPSIGIIDTDVDPSWVTYTIPANDDSMRSVSLIAGVLARSAQAGQKRRLAAADEGIVAWQTPPDTKSFIGSAKNTWKVEMKEWYADMASFVNAGEAEQSQRLLSRDATSRKSIVDEEA